MRVENVAGDTRVSGGPGEEVVVRARKRVHAESQERGRRVLDNIEVEIEQHGDEIHVSQRAYLLERGWMTLFRERRAVVDYEIEVPEQAMVLVRSASGDVQVREIRGAVEVQTVSGDAEAEQVRGPMRIRTVSGDCEATRCAGTIEANSVSGDLSFRGCAWRSGRVRSISGDIDASLRLDGPGPFGLTTVSGDVELATPSAFELRFDTTSGDLEASGLAAERLSRRSWAIRQGEGGAEIGVRTVSGDVSVRRDEVDAPEQPAATASGSTPTGERSSEALAILESLERGEVDVEEAARRIDAARR